jgi:carboxymethylenebutenolidase
MPAGRMIDIEAGNDVIRGWLAQPDVPDGRAGIVLVPDVHGLSAHYQDVAARYAAVGYVTLAVDLYSREGAPVLGDLAAVTAWIRALPDGRVLDDLVAARSHLVTYAGVAADAVAVIGHCMGGTYALLAAGRDDRWGACVAWYGMLRYHHYDERNPASPLDRAGDLGCPLLGLYGEEDALIPRADVAAWRSALATADRPVEVQTYPGAGHAFFNDTRPDAYRPVAAADAWMRTLAFLARWLPHAPAPPTTVER